MFFRYLWKKKYFILLFAVLTVVATVSKTMFHLYISPIFDDAQVGNYKSIIIRLGWMFLWYISFRLMNYYTELTSVHIINAVRRNIKQDLFAVALNRRLPDHATKNTGEYIAEFTNDITLIETKFLIPCKEIFSFVVTIVTTGVAIFTIDVRMAIVILVGASFCVLLPILATKYTASRMMKFITDFDNFVQHLKDMFGAFFTFKNYAVEDKVANNFSKENHKVEETKFKAEFSLVVMSNIIGRLSWSIEILVVVIGLLSVIRGELSIGAVFAAYLLAGNLGMPIQSFGGRISTMRSVKAIENKFKALQATDEKVKPQNAGIDNDSMFDIELKNVELHLKDKLILSEISTVFEQGKKYLIIGNNGSGKSSMAKLLKSTYSGYSGTVKLGKFDLDSPEGAELVRRISYSNENVSLFSDTVLNNILLYRNCAENRLTQAINMAEFTVPLDREVGENGRFLSSGERRKLEIARALIEDPKVLIFDEVVSTLDIETAFEIEKLILSLQDRTVIMISNAFSGQLLEKYDQIILMDNGKIIAQGKHNELLENCTAYKNIYNIRCSKQ